MSITAENGTGVADVIVTAAALSEALDRAISAENSLADLRAARASAAELATEARLGARREHEADIAIIGEWLIDEAENRDWCDDYDRLIDTINSRLTVPLPLREGEYEVIFQVTYRVAKTVNATNADAAYDEATGDFDLDSLDGMDPYTMDRVTVEKQ